MQSLRGCGRDLAESNQAAGDSRGLSMWVLERWESQSPKGGGPLAPSASGGSLSGLPSYTAEKVLSGAGEVSVLHPCVACPCYHLEQKDSRALLPKFLWTYYVTPHTGLTGAFSSALGRATTLNISFFPKPSFWASQPPWLSSWLDSLSSGGEAFLALCLIALWKGVPGRPSETRVGKKTGGWG